MKKLTKIISAVVAVVLAGGLIAAPAFADDPFCNPDMGAEAWKAMGCDDGTSGGTAVVSDVVVNILNVVIGMLAIVAVVFVVVGGVGYMTSAGDSTKLKKARDTILYAIIGLVICALAFGIVNFAVSIINGESGQQQSGGGGNSSSSPIDGNKYPL